MGELETFLGEHREAFPDCTEPLMSGRCKCGNSRVYTCVPHDEMWFVPLASCTCEWVTR